MPTETLHEQLYFIPMPMKRIPHAAHALIHTVDGPPLATQLLPIGGLEQLSLLGNGVG